MRQKWEFRGCGSGFVVGKPGGIRILSRSHGRGWFFTVNPVLEDKKWETSSYPSLQDLSASPCALLAPKNDTTEVVPWVHLSSSPSVSDPPHWNDGCPAKCETIPRVGGLPPATPKDTDQSSQYSCLCLSGYSCSPWAAGLEQVPEGPAIWPLCPALALFSFPQPSEVAQVTFAPYLTSGTSVTSYLSSLYPVIYIKTQ